MKSTILLITILFFTQTAFGQEVLYDKFIREADSLYDAQDYKNAALTYSRAFEKLEWKGYQSDRYNAACSWALAGEADSAFFQLERIANKSAFSDLDHLTSDPDLNSLHSDDRWATLLEKVKFNKEKAEENLDKPLAAQLDSIFESDQLYRIQIKEIEQKFGRESNEMKSHYRLMAETDSLNLIKVKSILDSRGWLGADIVGEKGNSCLFLVIQHADLSTQEKYLPMMREAVKSGNARASSLALLEDRVALRQGKKQIYGSQIGWNKDTKLYFVSPLEDPDNVDKRRAEVGLQPLSEYVQQWEIVWDCEQYKKDLPKLIELEKKK